MDASLLGASFAAYLRGRFLSFRRLCWRDRFGFFGFRRILCHRELPSRLFFPGSSGWFCVTRGLLEAVAQIGEAFGGVCIPALRVDLLELRGQFRGSFLIACAKIMIEQALERRCVIRNSLQEHFEEIDSLLSETVARKQVYIGERLRHVPLCFLIELRLHRRRRSGRFLGRCRRLFLSRRYLRCERHGRHSLREGHALCGRRPLRSVALYLLPRFAFPRFVVGAERFHVWDKLPNFFVDLRCPLSVAHGVTDARQFRERFWQMR